MLIAKEALHDWDFVGGSRAKGHVDLVQDVFFDVPHLTRYLDSLVLELTVRSDLVFLVLFEKSLQVNGRRWSFGLRRNRDR